MDGVVKSGLSMLDLVGLVKYSDFAIKVVVTILPRLSPDTS